MNHTVNKLSGYKQIQQLQIWYRISGICFAFIAFIGTLLFFTINQYILEESAYVILVVTTILYISIPMIINLFLSSPSLTVSLTDEIGKRHNRYRWVEYVFSSSLMIVTIGVLVGITSGVQFLLLAALNAIVILLGAIADWVSITRYKILLFSIASLIFAFYWVYLLRQFVVLQQSTLGEVIRLDSFHQLFFVVCLFCMFPLLFSLQHFSGYNTRYVFIDKLYILAGFITKTALFFVTVLWL